MRNRYFALIDLLILPAAIYLSYVLRLEDWALVTMLPGLLAFALVSMSIVPLVLWRFGMYSRFWPYASAEELLLLVGIATFGILVSGALAMGLLWGLGYATPTSLIPRSIPFIDLMLGGFAIVALRVLVRVLSWDFSQRLPFQRILHHQKVTLLNPNGRRDFLKTSWVERTPVLIIGAGAVGVRIAHEVKNNPRWKMEAIGFLDDDKSKHGSRIQGVPVLGNLQALPVILQTHPAQQVIIAMPAASGKMIREIVKDCEKARVQVKLMPSMHELLDGSVSVSKLRSVEIEDLLRRAPVQTDVGAVGTLICGKRVLVTGGGGSIGSELCRQIIRFCPSELILLGHGENSVFEIQNELRAIAPQLTIHAVIADIRFLDRLADVFNKHQPQMVFHAAAHKHVPLMEFNPVEAVTNNILGTRNLLAAASAIGVERFVMISSDKAVRPSSVMGVSKRVAELLVHRAAHQDGQRRRYCAVRFGNVLGSRGSVVLTFKKQIAAGGPVTITHPDMKRYFMTIPEAVQLVLQASVLNQGGEVFVLDMGEPIRIMDLAKDLITLSGLEVGRDIDIVSTGMRPGEKLFEELFLPDEQYARTQHAKIFIAANASNINPLNLMQGIQQLEEAARRGDDVAIISGLEKLVPEYRRVPAEQADPAAAQTHSQSSLLAAA